MSLAPGHKFRVLPGVGHTPMWDAPALIAGLIADFALAAEPARTAAPA